MFLLIITVAREIEPVTAHYDTQHRDNLGDSLIRENFREYLKIGLLLNFFFGNQPKVFSSILTGADLLTKHLKVD